MRVLAIVHQREAGPGVFADAIRDGGHDLLEWLPRGEEPPSLDGFGAVMVFGGAMDTHQEDAHPWLRPEKELLRELLARGAPLLGVCLGSQLLAEAAGARPRRARVPEIGWRDIELTAEAEGDPLLGWLPSRFEGFCWHSYEVPLPEGALPLAQTPVCLQAFRLGDMSWGLQFHAEVTSATVDDWLDDYRSDEDALRLGIEPEALRDETEARIAGWNAIGRGICERFLARAAARE